MDITIIARDIDGTDLDPHVFDSPRMPALPEALAELRGAVDGADLAAPPVVLPDFHHKSTMEIPSSVVVATRGSIRPTLTSASVNCGMTLMAFDTDRPARAAIEQFYRRVRERFPYPPGRRTELSAEDVLSCATEGAQFAARRFGIEAPSLERVEEYGALDLDRWDGADRLRRELPALVLRLARAALGLERGAASGGIRGFQASVRPARGVRKMGSAEWAVTLGRRNRFSPRFNGGWRRRREALQSIGKAVKQRQQIGIGHH